MTEEIINPEDLIPIETFAEQLNVHKVTLLRAIAAKKLKATNIGRGYRTTQKWIQEYIERQATEVEVK